MKKSMIFILAIMASMYVKAGKVDTIDVYSCLMQKEIKTVVITPSNYKKKKKENFPVVYLLHGFSGDHANWIKYVPKLTDLVDQYQLIVICPDGDFDSWYLDVPGNLKSQYESFLSNELVHHIDKNYRTRADTTGRALTGLSMGGFGGIYVGLKHPETFGAIGAMSGALELPVIMDKRFGIDKRLGDTTGTLRKQISTYALVDSIKPTKQKILFDCGTEDFCVGFANELHTRLLKRRIPHEYISRPGAHNWKYWANAIEYQLLFFSRYFYKEK